MDINMDEALVLLSDMRWELGKSPCFCVSSAEEIEYQRRLSEVQGVEARLLWCIENEAPEETIAEECLRCELLGRYETLIGSEAFDADWEDHNEPLSAEEQAKLVAAIMGVINKEKGEAS